MSRLRFKISISLDGFVTGPNQSVDNPLGIGGMRLHEWAFGLAVFRVQHGMEDGEVNESTRVIEESLANIGATVMGRNMFGGHPGPWEAKQQARRAAGGKDVSLTGGAKASQQFLATGLVDEMEISVVPTLLGSGERLFDDVGDDLHGLELVRTVAAPQVTHIKFAKTLRGKGH
ncbi:MAG TPA: dihydrofolate reductase family protein [Gemmatimonadaceae bacterium]|nr:dihydrofolate reductase family protein [Gemmatimonadaceae bacterium]